MSEVETSEQANDPPELVYEPNAKHKEPWQIGRKGSLCEKEVHQHAKSLLERSVQEGTKRYYFGTEIARQH